MTGSAVGKVISDDSVCGNGIFSEKYILKYTEK